MRHIIACGCYQKWKGQTKFLDQTCSLAMATGTCVSCRMQPVPAAYWHLFDGQTSPGAMVEVGGEAGIPWRRALQLLWNVAAAWWRYQARAPSKILGPMDPGSGKLLCRGRQVGLYRVGTGSPCRFVHNKEAEGEWADSFVTDAIVGPSGEQFTFDKERTPGRLSVAHPRGNCCFLKIKIRITIKYDVLIPISILFIEVGEPPPPTTTHTSSRRLSLLFPVTDMGGVCVTCFCIIIMF